MEVRTKISVELVLTAPFTDLSKGGDTTNLLVDVRRQKLIDNFTSLSAPARSTTNALFSSNFFYCLGW